MQSIILAAVLAIPVALAGCSNPTQAPKAPTPTPTGLEYLNILGNPRLSGCIPKGWSSIRVRADHQLEPCE